MFLTALAEKVRAGMDPALSWWGSGGEQGVCESLWGWPEGLVQSEACMERVFGGMSPLKKILKGSHRFLKQLLQRVDPRPVSTLSLNDNTIAEETKIRNCNYPSIHASTRLSKHLSFNPSIYTFIVHSFHSSFHPSLTIHPYFLCWKYRVVVLHIRQVQCMYIGSVQ